MDQVDCAHPSAMLAQSPEVTGMNHQTLRTLSSKPMNWAFGCNVAVIVIGTIIAVCGILAWAVGSPRDNAIRQILPARG